MTARKYTWIEVYRDRDGDDVSITHRGTEAQYRKAMMAFKSHPFGVGLSTDVKSERKK